LSLKIIVCFKIYFGSFIEQIRDLILNVSTNKSLLLVNNRISFKSKISNVCFVQYVPINILGYFMTEIYLTSVKSAITFYEKYGFTKYDKLCNDMCIMIKSLKKRGGRKRKTRKYKKSLKRTRKNHLHLF
jgi:hypothetical protein